MSSAEKKAVEEEGGGESAPLWIISFADMISLLMAFFVMLSTFNNFDKEEEQKLEATVRATLMECGGWTSILQTETLAPNLAEGDNISKGPEIQPASTNAFKSGEINETYSKEFFTDRTFLVPMEFLFYSSSTGLTVDGKRWLDGLAVYLSKMPGQILIAEQNTAQKKASGPLRAVAVAEYLVRKNIETGRISIGTHATSLDSSVRQNQALEISLLEKDICP